MGLILYNTQTWEYYIFVSGTAIPNDLREKVQGTRCRQGNYTFLTLHFQVFQCSFGQPRVGYVTERFTHQRKKEDTVKTRLRYEWSFWSRQIYWFDLVCVVVKMAVMSAAVRMLFRNHYSEGHNRWLCPDMRQDRLRKAWWLTLTWLSSG